MNRQEPPRNSEQRTDSRAVSDAIGFTLMFAIIIIGAGLISLAGGAQLASLSEAEEVRSAERGMQSAAATLQPMASDGDTHRSFTLAFSNSNVWMNETTLNVTTEDGTVDNESLQVNSLEQRFDQSDGDVTVRYEGGGVFRSNAVPAYDPVFSCRDDTAIVTVVNLTLDEREGLYISQGYDPDLRFDEFAGTEDPPIASTDAALNFRASLVDSERYHTDDGSTIVVNTTQTAGPDRWELYFEDQDNWSAVDSEEHTYECAAEQSLVRVVTIELDVIDPRFAD